MGIEIVCEDVIHWAKNYKGMPYHALLCDAPYNLETISERFGKEGSAPAKEGTDGAFKRMSRGFMNCEWDNQIAMNPNTWKAISQHLYPGAFLFVFVGCLNDDLISLAMREAGLIKFHSFYWIFGSGFPKATNISKTLDKRAGEEGDLIAEFERASRSGGIMGKETKVSRRGDTPATDMAKAWAGHRYGRQAIKPATEVILIFRKPYDKSPVDSIVETGAGALNIEAGRIGVSNQDRKSVSKSTRGPVKGKGYVGNFGLKCDHDPVEFAEGGRWPSNLLISDDVAPLLDAQSGERTVGAIKPYKQKHNPSAYSVTSGMATNTRNGSTGGASRYFQQTNWNAEVEERLEETEPYFYTAKAGPSEREKGLENFIGGTIRSTYDKSVRDKNGNDTGYERKNIHPCQKPLSLTSYLSKLLAPPVEYAPRRLLVPFAGAGSEALGAYLSGLWEEITAIEISSEYCAIAEGRLRYWSANIGLFETINAQEETTTPVQETLDWED